MAKNIIYYGPPGTGKTYHMQKLISDYTDYKITNDEIINAYNSYSQDWLLFALIILQSNTTMTTEEIIKIIRFTKTPLYNWRHLLRICSARAWLATFVSLSRRHAPLRAAEPFAGSPIKKAYP